MRNRKFRVVTALVFHALILLQAGCPDDIGTSSASEGTTASSSSDSTGFLPTTTESATDSTTGGPVCEQNYPLPIEEFVLADAAPLPTTVFPARSCDTLGLVGTADNQLDPMADIFDVYVYRPLGPIGGWPGFKLPYVIFSPGAGQFAANSVTHDSFYLPLIEAYTSVGFVVFAIQPPPPPRDWSVGHRGHAMACTALWAFNTWIEKDNERLNCDFVVSGHSRGGEAAYYFAQTVVGPLIALGLEGRILRGVVTLAPRSKPAQALPNTDVFTSVVAGDLTVPYLTLHGANDEDVKTDATRAFELFGDEEATPLSKHDKFLLWAHDILHNSWGGVGTATPKAAAIESLYVPAFLRWQILEVGDPSDRQLFMDLLHYDRSLIMFDSSVDVDADWDQCLPEHTDLGEEPVIFGDFTPGLMGDPDARLQIDTMKRANPTACMSAVSPSSSSGGVTLSGFGSGQVCMGTSENLTIPIPMGSDEQPHQSTSAMRVRWGDQESEGTIEWEVNLDLSDYAFLSFRVGQIFHLSPESMTTIKVGIRTPSGMITQVFSVEVNVYTQDDQPVAPLAIGSPRHIGDFMRTIRIPLAEFCAQGADISAVEDVVVEFLAEANSRTILFDSVEFTKSADSAEPGQCL